MPHAEWARDHILVKTNYHENAAMDNIPGKRWRPQEEKWRCPLSMSTCYALRATFGDQLTVDQTLTEWANAEMQRWITASTWLTNPSVLALPPSNQIGPSTLHDAVEAFEACDAGSYRLKPYQAVASVHKVLARGAIDGSEVGTGKTPNAIMALRIANRLYAQNPDAWPDPWPALVVCPSSLKKNWAREFDKWFPAMEYEIIRGTAAKKRDAFARALGYGKTIIINYDSLRTASRLAPYGSIRLKRCAECGGMGDVKPTACEVHDRELNEFKARTVIADEAHRIKDPSTKQSRALTAAAKHAVYRWAMTGTPVEKNPVDFWALLHFIAPDEWPTKVGFIDRHVIKYVNLFGGMEYGGFLPETEPEIRRSINARMLRHIKAQVLPDLPKKQHEVRAHELKPVEKSTYLAMKKSLIAEVKGGQIIGWNPMVQTGRLVQAAASALEVDGEDVIPVEPSSKLDAVTDTLTDYEGVPVILFFVSRKLLKLYAERLDKAEVKYVTIHGEVSESDRDSAVQKFQGGEVDRILVTVGAGGEGLTLTRAPVAIHVQRPWSLLKKVQSEGRNDRIGSEIHEVLKDIDIVAEDTVEEEILARLVEKGENFEDVVRDKNRLLALLETK